MSEKAVCVGIDASNEAVSICILDVSGSVLDEVNVDASVAAVKQVLAEHDGQMVIGLEACSAALRLTRGLRDDGFDVRLLETRHVHAFLNLKQNKTDRNDARGIAEIMRIGWQNIPEVLIKREGLQRLRSEIVLRHRLMQQRLATESAIRSVLRLNGGKIGRTWSGTHLEKSVAAEVERLRSEGIDLADVLLPTLGAAVAARRSVEAITKRLTRLARENEVCTRLMTVPGVGCISALSFYTAVDDPHRFIRNEDVGPYLGLAPKLTQSGQTSRMGRISKRGNRMTRSHLVSAAKVLMQLSKHDNSLRRWALEIKARAGSAKAQVALARKLAVVMLAIWKSGERFNPEPRTASPLIAGTNMLSASKPSLV